MTEHIYSTSQLDRLLKGSTIVIVDFYADWCGPCKAIAPVYERLSREFSKAKAVTFAKVDVDRQKEIARQYDVRAMPTFIIFRNSVVIETIPGADPRALNEAVENAVADVAPVSEFTSEGRRLGEGAEASPAWDFSTLDTALPSTPPSSSSRTTNIRPTSRLLTTDTNILPKAPSSSSRTTNSQPTLRLRGSNINLAPIPAHTVASNANIFPTSARVVASNTNIVPTSARVVASNTNIVPTSASSSSRTTHPLPPPNRTLDSDAALAARLQAAEDARGGSSRAAQSGSTPPSSNTVNSLFADRANRFSNTEASVRQAELDSKKADEAAEQLRLRECRERLEQLAREKPEYGDSKKAYEEKMRAKSVLDAQRQKKEDAAADSKEKERIKKNIEDDKERRRLNKERSDRRRSFR